MKDVLMRPSVCLSPSMWHGMYNNNLNIMVYSASVRSIRWSKLHVIKSVAITKFKYVYTCRDSVPIVSSTYICW